MERNSEMYKQWVEAFASVGMNHLSFDTCAKILAVVYVYGGGNEDFTLNDKLRVDYNSAQRRFNITGGETPDAEGVEAINAYIMELENDIKNSALGEIEGAPFVKVCHVEWAVSMFNERYGIKLRT